MSATIEFLGECRFLSPLRHFGPGAAKFKIDSERILYDDRSQGDAEAGAVLPPPLTFEVAGPREWIYFDPAKTIAAVVTCGGLSPGLNDVIRGIVMELWHRYHVTEVTGVRFGFEGLVPRHGHIPLKLKPETVSNIQSFGGTILGSSRGPQDINEMADALEELGIDILFTIGGEGTLKGAEALAAEIQRRGLRKSVIAIPKTIDNDILYLDKTFGFETAFAEAVKAVACAHVEAICANNGVGLVKLMGRESGFIVCYATLASQQVNFCLIPEVPFELDGPRGFLEALRYRIALRKHAVIVVAEGAGQTLLKTDSADTDASGNRRLGDIGLFLRDQINHFFRSRNVPITLKYIDPSYAIRSVPASPQDNVYCTILAQNAVHAGMAGKTNMLVGRWHDTFVHIPLNLVTGGRRRIEPEGDIWRSVLEATGQPIRMF
ncbi:MAG TPA: ATP-dependent 6-phosphofructokinase [Chthoniobacterales bacterium]|jgi:6-phosphofructokinase 1|nr:ATP-dependent 6-phosphofructokinase [Chthoniobacterales bacterium]